MWDDFSSDISDAPQDFDPPMIVDSPFSRGQVIAKWILRFLMVMQASFKIPDIVIDHFLRFFAAIFTILGDSSEIVRDVCLNLPSTVYRAKKAIGELLFTRYVVCQKCFAIYTHSESIETIGTVSKSKRCSFCRFPSHPYRSMRLPCQTLLLKTVELASKRTYLYPFVTYCYLGVETSLQNLFERPNFYTDCEKWRSRSTGDCTRIMRDVHDGEMWRSFLRYKDEPFLSEPGNLGLILNFDFFQPFDHLTYSLGAIYMCVLNLPRESRYKQENVILVGLIPGPHEPKRDINTFLRPLVDDLCRLWVGVQFNICSLKSSKIIRCALICVACDLPADAKFVGFWVTGPDLAALSVTRNLQGQLVQWIIQGLKDVVGEYVQVMNIPVWHLEAKIYPQNQQWSKLKVETAADIQN